MSKRVLTANQSSFAQTVHADIQRSIFSRPSSNKLTFNCGQLVPLYIDEVLPGDTFNFNMKFLSRLSTPIFPTMDDINLEYYAFFVPNRLVWDGWEELNGENKTGAWTPAEEPALVPVYESGIVKSKGLGDYYGLPYMVDLSKDANKVSCLPFRGYNLIWNEWFRDENLQAPVPLNKGNTITEVDEVYGPNGDLFKVNKYHDYFTSALPAPQKGESPLIPIELNQLIPVITGSRRAVNSSEAAVSAYYKNGGLSDLTWHDVLFRTDESGSSGHKGSLFANKSNTTGPAEGGQFVFDNLYADARNLGPINASTISELRTAFQIQKLYEKDARGGKLLCLHVKKIAEKIWKALYELIRGEGLCQPQRIVSEII